MIDFACCWELSINLGQFSQLICSVDGIVSVSSSGIADLPQGTLYKPFTAAFHM